MKNIISNIQFVSLLFAILLWLALAPFTIEAIRSFMIISFEKPGADYDFLLTFRRDQRAAERFFNKSIQNHGIPAKANVDKSGANMAALDFVNESNRNRIEVRQQKYLNNIVEQDHRFIKKKTKSLLGFKAFYSAKNILAGVEEIRLPHNQYKTQQLSLHFHQQTSHYLRFDYPSQRQLG
jgi:transposase-like protein